MKHLKFIGTAALVLCAALMLCACDNTATQTEADVTTTTVQMTEATAAVTETTTTTEVTTTTEATTQATQEVTTTTEATTEATTEPTEETIEVEVLGTGVESDPYLETPNLETMTLTTVEIPAGGSIFYGIYRVGNMILTIEDAAAYVVCDSTRYDAENGVVMFTVPNALASDAVMFEIGNSGASAATFTVSFANQKGSQMDPEVITTMSGDHAVSLAEDASTGYYFQYIAEKAGTIRFYMTASVESMLYATNNRNSAQRSTESDALTDENGKTYIELEVEAGDEVIVNVAAKPDRRGRYAATDITWSGEYQ